MNKKEFRITKLEKGDFRIEFKYGRWGEWHLIDKKFKSITKAKEYIMEQE